MNTQLTFGFKLKTPSKPPPGRIASAKWWFEQMYKSVREAPNQLPQNTPNFPIAGANKKDSLSRN